MHITGKSASSYLDGARRAGPIGAAVALDGVAFGVLAEGVGMAPGAAVAMSALVFSGTAQFAAVAVVSAGGGTLLAAATAALIGARAVPMGLSVAPAIQGGPLRRALRAQLVVDESWAVAQVGPARWDVKLLLGAGAVVWAAWVSGTSAGAFGAGLIDNPQQLGLDAAFPALFLALLAPQLRSRRSAAASLASALLVLVLIPSTPAGVPIAAASLICIAGVRRR